jgi:two-component system response regulator PilR (NtrC family)
MARIAHDAGIAPVPTISTDALQLLRQYAFPGNVRELENLLHRALAMSGEDQIDADDLGLGELAGLDDEPDEATPVAPRAPAAPAEAALPNNLEAYLDAVERDILERALEKHRFNRTAAGASLGLSLRQMRYRMARLGVDAGAVESPADRGEGR